MIAHQWETRPIGSETLHVTHLPTVRSPRTKRPKAHAYLLFGFTLARANARMLINAEAKRRSARNSVRASRPQCTSAVAVHG